MGHGDRAGPVRVDDLASAAQLRWQLDPQWRPGALGHIARALDLPPLDPVRSDLSPTDLLPPVRQD
jgi:hypothetical protein